MEAGTLLIAIGAFLLAGVGYLVFQVVAEIAVDEAKEAVFRRPSFAVRRSRHRALMMTGYVCAVLALMAALFWLAATSGREADAADAGVFAMLAAVLALAAAGLLTTWWRRAGRPKT